MNNTLLLVSSILQGLMALSANMQLGGHKGENWERFSGYLSLLSRLLEEGEEAYNDIELLSQQIQQMVEENRGPTSEELQILEERSQEAHNRLQAVKEELLVEEETTENEEGLDLPSFLKEQ